MSATINLKWWWRRN